MNSNKFIKKIIDLNTNNLQIPFDENSKKEIYYVTFNRCETKEDINLIKSFIEELYTSNTLKEENKSIDNMIIVVDPALYFNIALLEGDALSVNSMINPDNNDFTNIVNDCYNYAYSNIIPLASKVFIVNTDDNSNIIDTEVAILKQVNPNIIVEVSVIYDATKYELFDLGFRREIILPKIENLIDETTDAYLKGLIQKIKDINYDSREIIKNFDKDKVVELKEEDF